MKPWLQVCWRTTRLCCSSVWAFVVWTLWLVLASLLVLQVYIASTNELAVPAFILRQIGDQLEASGAQAAFGRTAVDPSGRVLIENLRIQLPGFAEPVVTIRSVYLQLNPWSLILGRVETGEVKLSGVSAAVPAMLSATGRAQEVLRDFDLTFTPARHALVIRQLSGRIGALAVTARGTLVLPGTGDTATPSGAVRDFLQHRFAQACRQALAVQEELGRFDEPALHLEFYPSESGAPAIQVQVFARQVRPPGPFPGEVDEFKLSTRLVLFGENPAAQIDVSAAEIRIEPDIRIRGLQAQLLGRLQASEVPYDLREAAVTLDALHVGSVVARAVALRAFPRPLPRLEVTSVANLLGAPLAVRADLNLAQRNATVEFEGLVAPSVLDQISARVGGDIRKVFDFDSLRVERARARFGDQFHFERLDARVILPKVQANGITLTDARATVELEPGRLYSPEAFARVGEYHAAGTYEHDLTTNRFRFLLDGRLRPLAISPWFREWWSDFFRQLEFPVAPPDASVDVRGVWRDGSQSRVFVFADVPQPIVRGTPLDRVRTRLFIRPGLYDGLEVLAARGEGTAYGRFTYLVDPVTLAFRSLEFGMTSTLELKAISQLLGPAVAKSLEPIRLAQAPTLNFTGRYTQPEGDGPGTSHLKILARTDGEFRFHNFPLQDAAFTATLDDSEIIIDDITAKVADGDATGHVRIWGDGPQRRLGFDVTLANAQLGLVAYAHEEYFSALKGLPPAPPDKFFQEKGELRLDFAASAEGRYDDVLSYRGDGSALLRGASIGEVALLGQLTELLRFASLRFSEGRANFKIEGPKVAFSEITLTGSNSALNARGTYALESRELDFTAKVFPFQESANVLKNVVGAVLAPLSVALEVKLVGSSSKPRSEFVRGPTNLLRTLVPGEEKEVPAAPVGTGDPRESVPPAPAAETPPVPTPAITPK